MQDPGIMFILSKLIPFATTLLSMTVMVSMHAGYRGLEIFMKNIRIKDKYAD
jgi:hypothetical protein